MNGVKRASTEHSQQKAQHFWVTPTSEYSTHILACTTAAAPRAAHRRYERRHGILVPGRACVRKRLRWRPYPPHCSSAPWPTRTTRAAERYTPPAQYEAPRSPCVSAATHGPTVTAQKTWHRRLVYCLCCTSHFCTQQQLTARTRDGSTFLTDSGCSAPSCSDTAGFTQSKSGSALNFSMERTRAG